VVRPTVLLPSLAATAVVLAIGCRASECLYLATCLVVAIAAAAVEVLWPLQTLDPLPPPRHHCQLAQYKPLVKRLRRRLGAGVALAAAAAAAIIMAAIIMAAIIMAAAAVAVGSAAVVAPLFLGHLPLEPGCHLRLLFLLVIPKAQSTTIPALALAALLLPLLCRSVGACLQLCPRTAQPPSLRRPLL